MTNKLSDSTKKFWNDIHALAAVVRDLAKEQSGDRLCDIQSNVRKSLTSEKKDFSEMAARMLAYVDRLLQLQTGRSSGENEKNNDPKMGEWLKECREVWIEHHKSTVPADNRNSVEELDSDFRARRDEILMENLTAGWLGLYFIGVPFIQPWEGVRRLADERGGFPSGACVTKYLGDVYRTSRQQMFRDFGGVTDDEEKKKKQDQCGVLVLSYAPLALLEGLLDFADGNLTPAAVHKLGWCYALLQLRLYIRQGFPIKYLVPHESLHYWWVKLGGLEKDKNKKMIKDIKPWLKTVFPDTSNKRQTVKRLMASFSALGMPTCVLGYNTGMCVLDTSQYPTPFSGNQIGGDLLASCREKLQNMQEDDNLKTWTDEQFEKVLRE